jgi:hypothetical protein
LLFWQGAISRLRALEEKGGSSLLSSDLDGLLRVEGGLSIPVGFYWFSVRRLTQAQKTPPIVRNGAIANSPLHRRRGSRSVDGSRPWLRQPTLVEEIEQDLTIARWE